MSRMNAKSKYRAKPTVVDGIRFASMKEAKRYQELKLLERAGAIRDLKLQPKFPMCVWPNAFIVDVDTPKTIATYVADFSYYDVAGRDIVIEDVKGFKTPVYRLKKKMVEAQYGVEIREV